MMHRIGMAYMRIATTADRKIEKGTSFFGFFISSPAVFGSSNPT
jgi:hypothetical protein